MTQLFGIKPIVTGNPTVPLQPPEGTGAPNSQAPVLQQPQEQPVQPASTARSMTQKLDSMLFKVAEAATRSVSSTKLHKTMLNMQLPVANRRKLVDAADSAAGTFAALSKFTGRQLANALVVGKDGKFDWADNPAAVAIKEALDAQAELSKQLHDFVNEPNVTGEAFETLSEMALQADRRQTEILTLALDLADKAAESGDDPDIVAKLDAKLATLLPRQSLTMHGNDAALEILKESLQPLADRIDSFASRPNASISSEELAALQHETAMARNALEMAEKEGFETADGGHWMPDKMFFSTARQFVAFAEGKLANTRKEIGMCSVNAFVEKTFKLSDDFPVVYEENLKNLSRVARNLANAALLRHQIYALAKSYVKNPVEETKNKLLALADQYCKFDGKKIQNEIEMIYRVGGDMDEDDWAALEETFKEPRGMMSQVVHLILTVDHIATDLSPEQLLSTDSAKALMEGRLAFSTIVEARIHGMQDTDVNPKLDDSNLVSVKTLGSGAVNTVYLVKYKDDSEYVFKPEAQGRQGMEKLTLTKDYNPAQQVTQLNLATQKTAEVLGLEDVMPKSTVGCHNGQYGLFMEKAPGTTADAFVKGQTVNGGLTAEQVKGLPKEQYEKVIGEIIRQTNRLEWLDLITGQGDRHGKNYMIDVRPDFTVTVKGIDNDQCFTAYRTGLRSFHLTKDHANKFLETKEKIINEYPKKYRAEIRNRLDNDPGVVKNADGSLDIDATKFKAGELHYALRKAVGLHNAVLPDFIDEDTYEHLQALKAGETREAYIADLRTRLPEEAVASAIARLDQAIAYAEALKGKDMVVSKADFSKQAVQNRIMHPEVYDRRPLEPTNDGKFCLKQGKIPSKIKHQIHSLFFRDMLSTLYKRQWFVR